METWNGCEENQCDVDLDPELQNIIEAVQDEATKKALMDLAVRFRKKQIQDNERFDQIFNLYNDINDRLREQERYSSKDSLVIKNPPFNSRDSENLFMNLKTFFHEYLKLDLKEENLKAFHVLPTRRNLPDNLMPPVILKFIYFREKETAYRQRKLLKPDPKENYYPKNPINNKQIYLNERLPAIENMIKKYAEEKNYITSTNKCVVSVLCLDPNDPNGVNKIMIPVKMLTK